MIKLRRFLGLTVISGTRYEMDRLKALSGASLNDGDAVAVVPAFSHVHRNPRRKALIRYIEDREGEK